MRKIKNIIKNPYKLIYLIKSPYLLRLIPDKTYIKILYRANVGKKLNLGNPQTFNEKIQWLKLFDRRPEYTLMVDKFAVREYIKNNIGEEYLIPLLGVWSGFKDINFYDLPQQFVLKPNHTSGDIFICLDKKNIDINNLKRMVNRWLRREYYWQSREWPYKNIKPKIIAEQYLVDESGELKDYKFLCFNGRVEYCFVCSERFSKNGLKVTFFDRDWNVMPFERHYPKSKKPIVKPYNFDKMITLAEKLSKNIPFVRVDFYEVNKKIYFGELTFYPGSGLEEFTPPEWDEKLGNLIELPNN